MTKQNFEQILNKISTPIFMAKKIENGLDFEFIFQNDAFLEKFGNKTLSGSCFSKCRSENF